MLPVKQARYSAGAHALALALLAIACGDASRTRDTPLPSVAVQPRMPAPVIRQIGDGRTWLLRAPVVYRAGTGDTLVVPAGFVAEFAGVPRWFHRYLLPADAAAGPAIVQDYLYWTARCTRAESDGVFRRAMREQGVPDSLVAQLHDAASAWGGTAWRTYEQARAAGLPRFVPPRARADLSLESWKQYRMYLRDSARAAEPTVVASARLCALGRE